MNPETLSALIDNNEASKKELRDQKRAIGKKVLDNGQEHIGDEPEKIMEGYESARDLAKRLGVDLGTIFRVGSKIEGVERQKYKTEVGRDAYRYCLEDVEKIQNKINEQIPDGYESAKDLAVRLGVNITTVFRVADALDGVERKILRNKNGKDANFFSPKDVKKIEDKINERAPDGYEDARNIASRLNVDYQTIFNVVKKIPSVERKKFRTESGIEVTYFSLEDVKKIEDRINERAPDGYKTAGEIAKHLGTSKQTVERIINKLDGVERKDFRTESGVKAYYYSPKDIESIKNERARQVHKKLGSQALKNKKNKTETELAPEGYESARDLAERLGTTLGTIFRVESKIEGVERQKYKTEVGRDAYYYSSEDVRKIEEKYNERAPEGYESAKDLAARLGVHLQTVFRIASELEGVKEKKFKNDNNKDASYYSSEDVRKIEEKYNERAPEGYESARDLAERLGITRTTLSNIADDLTSVERKKFRTESGIEAYYYSPEDVRKIEEKYNERAPEGYESARDLAERLGTTLGTILKTARRMTDVEEKIHKTQNGKEAIHYTIDDAKKIEYELGKIAPNNYKTADDLATLFGVVSTTITKKAKEGKIDGTIYRTMKGVKAVHYSLEEQNEIAEIMEQSTCNSSFPENAIAFYFEQSGIDIEQNIRPDWLENPSTGRNLEIDIFISSLGIGLEYDGWRYHQKIERDIKKDFLMQREGYRVVHIREDGCPDLPEESDCIKRQKNNNDADLARCIKQCFEIIGLPTPDIDVVRDKKDIMAFMRRRVLDKLDSARTFEELSVAS